MLSEVDKTSKPHISSQLRKNNIAAKAIPIREGAMHLIYQKCSIQISKSSLELKKLKQLICSDAYLSNVQCHTEKSVPMKRGHFYFYIKS